MTGQTGNRSGHSAINSMNCSVKNFLKEKNLRNQAKQLQKQFGLYMAVALCHEEPVLPIPKLSKLVDEKRPLDELHLRWLKHVHDL